MLSCDLFCLADGQVPKNGETKERRSGQEGHEVQEGTRRTKTLQVGVHYLLCPKAQDDQTGAFRRGKESEGELVS